MSATLLATDKVKALVKSNDLVLNTDMQELAADFARVSRAVDDRLRRCTDFITRGLRVEALHHAELPPKLLDEIAHLSFPERTVWDDLTAQYGLPKGVPPDPDRAAELSRAYGEQQPLENLTKKLRALSRSRATTADRLTVLHDLVKLDGDNPVWTESLGAFEGEAYKQLSAEADEALAAEDDYKCDDLFGKLASPAWKTPPPAETMLRLARRTVPLLCDQLTHALQQRNRVKYLELKDKLAARVAAAALAADTKPAVKARQLIEKAEAADMAEFEREQYDAVLVNVEQLLQDPNAPVADVNDAYEQLVAFDREIPRHIEKLFKAWERRNQEKHDAKYTYLAVALMAFGVLFLVGLIWMLKK